MRKADLSVNTIIVIAIGLIVMFLLIAIFTGKIRIFGSNIEGSCEQQSGCCLNGPEMCQGKPSEGQCPDNKPIKKWTTGCCPLTGNCDAGKSTGFCCLPSNIQ